MCNCGVLVYVRRLNVCLIQAHVVDVPYISLRVPIAFQKHTLSTSLFLLQNTFKHNNNPFEQDEEKKTENMAGRLTRGKLPQTAVVAAVGFFLFLRYQPRR